MATPHPPPSVVPLPHQGEGLVRRSILYKVPEPNHRLGLFKGRGTAVGARQATSRWDSKIKRSSPINKSTLRPIRRYTADLLILLISYPQIHSRLWTTCNIYIHSLQGKKWSAQTSTAIHRNINNNSQKTDSRRSIRHKEIPDFSTFSTAPNTTTTTTILFILFIFLFKEKQEKEAARRR